jgi:hypothetical protein
MRSSKGILTFGVHGNVCACGSCGVCVTLTPAIVAVAADSFSSPLHFSFVTGTLPPSDSAFVASEQLLVDGRKIVGLQTVSPSRAVLGLRNPTLVEVSPSTGL